MTPSTASAWSNPSVLNFAGGRDPLLAAKEAAEGLLVRAKEANIEGPPVDVIALAEELGISLRPSDEVVDARTVRGEDGNLVIEFNVNRPRGRLRYSIAHELGHCCFPDVLAQPRHRTALGAVASPSDDSWELELVCNVIAAELLLPDRAIEGLLESETDIDFIMEARRRWDVSTEALLRRIVSSTPRAIALLALSRRKDSLEYPFSLDYADFAQEVPAQDPARQLLHGDDLEPSAAFTTITAVGQTARTSYVLGDSEYQAQMVGVPGFPGSRYPRVLVLLEGPSRESPIAGVDYVTSDILDLEGSDGPVVVAHVVSDAARSWGRLGVANTIARAAPDFAQAFRAWAIADRTNLRLGNIHKVRREIGGRDLTVISMVAQEGFGARWDARLRYDALEDCLRQVGDVSLDLNATVHLPRIGAGQAGGRWDYIEKIIDATLVERGVRVVIHTLPNARRVV